MDHALKAMDNHQYSQAQSMLQSELDQHPSDPKLMVLLAETDLGLAGIELMDFIQKISAPQPAIEQLDLFAMPNCSTAKISKLQGADIRCVLIRVMEHLPDADEPHFLAARELLRKAYPQAKDTPVDVNFLSAIVELGSAMSRAKVMLEKTEWIQENQGRELDKSNFHFVVHNLKNEFEELRDGLERVRYSYGKLSKYVVNLDGKPVIKIGDQELVFSENLDLPTLLRFAVQVIAEHADSVNYDVSRLLNNGLEDLPDATITVIQRLDRVYSLGFFADDMLDPTMRFDKAIESFVALFYEEKQEDHSFDLFDLFWKHPPGILKTFPDAVSKSWNSEEIDPLQDYYNTSQDQWVDLKQLMADWSTWMNTNVSDDQQRLISDYLRLQKKTDSRLSLPPPQLTDDSLKLWQTQITAAAKIHLTEVLESKVQGLPTFTSDQQKSGMDLLARTFLWIETNLWTVQ